MKTNQQQEMTREMFDHKNEDNFKYIAGEGLTEEIIHKISDYKKEPEWMRQFRLNSLKIFNSMPVPNWGPDLSPLMNDFNKIKFFATPDAKENATKWEDLPEDIRKTFERLGIPEAERNVLGGVGLQYESQAVYHNLKKDLEGKGVIFTDCDIAIQKYPELFKEHFMTKCVPVALHKFSALHAAVWSGGTFIYIPKNVKVEIPLQAYFRMNAEKMGQFEHTLIIVDEGAEMQYIEGCSSPRYNESSIHAGCVEIHVKKKAKASYISVENWSKNTFNLNTKRAIVDEEGTINWINGNNGSKVTMLYPCSILVGRKARSDFLGIAFAGKGQNQDTGTKIYHLAPETTSITRSKSIAKDGGITSYRGLLKVSKNAHNTKAAVQCDALLIDEQSKSNTFPFMEIGNKETDIAHEATVGKISDEQIFYLRTRGLSEEQAMKMIVAGFIEPIVKALPLEYAVELNRLIELEMDKSLG